jgi:hypothetical protein
MIWAGTLLVLETLQLDFVANGEDWNRPANESWGFDNVRVTLLNVVPEPGSIMFLTMAALAVSRWRRNNVTLAAIRRARCW